MEVVFTNKAPKPIGPYSQAIFAGNTLFCSGQIALDATTGEVVDEDVVVQTEKVMENIREVLKAKDMDFRHIVKTTIFVLDMADFSAVNEIYGKCFPVNPPARSTIAVKSLPKNVKVEIEVIAMRTP